MKSIPSQTHTIAPWVARGLIGLVTFFNLQAAFLFLFNPQAYTPGFELSGAAGDAMVQGMGLLFVMWNVPYVFALLDPIRNRRSLLEAVIMQAIGVVGETALLWALPGAHPLIHASVLRFIVFDGSGLVFLLVAWWVTRHIRV
ncbi:hypothetical protein SDC9_103538 [bioreactor metagenome]|uniref:Uncharacterized protein n=1 Tax=bioreactor metagenome TaxID=1076179 RepID=A0A645B4S5_9ZZZZ